MKFTPGLTICICTALVCSTLTYLCSRPPDPPGPELSCDVWANENTSRHSCYDFQEKVDACMKERSLK